MTIRLGTFNLHHGVGASGRFDRAGMVAACRALDVDVLALQEVDRRAVRTRYCDQAGAIGSALGLHASFGSTRNLGPLGRYGLALLTRWRPIAVESWALPASAQRRVALVAELAPSGRRGAPELTVVCTHLQNDAAVALGQLEVLLRRLSARSGAVVLLGDLNRGPDDVEPLLTAHGFTPAASGPTFPAARPDRRIDWIAARGLELADGVVHLTEASDHRPLTAETVGGADPDG